MHDNAGARLKSEICCLHPTLLNPSYRDKHVPDQFTNDLVEMQETTSAGERTRNTEAAGDPGTYPWL
jgi:hypothetical protein